MRRSRFSDPANLPLLTNPSWSACEGWIKEFEAAWQRGEAPNIGDYLRADGPARKALLIELAHIDLELRLKSGAGAGVEGYLAAHPELAADRGATLELIAAEYELRQAHQGGADRNEYRLRFPELWEDLWAYLASRDPYKTQLGTEQIPVGPVSWPSVPGYEILRELGRGGMGVVYQAREPSLGRLVALKFLPAEYARDPDRLGRFLREARTASALNHPHICTIHALGNHQGQPYIVMEYIDGQTLHRLLARRPRIDEVARVIGQAARALAAAHAAGVVHRDIKPENVMVRPDGYVKVLDFGLARRLPTLARLDPDGGRDTDPGVLLGTAAYMSPEQARGMPADSTSDIFSLGIVLYQLATGKHPFEADSALGTLYAITAQPQLPPSRVNPAVPAALERLLEAMLHKDPRLRPQAADVESALASLAEAGCCPAPANTTPARPLVRREPELAALRGALAAVESGAGAFVCVAGEPGIGKTTLIEDFLEQQSSQRRDCLVARGHCSERLAGTEAYLPVLDALGNLLRGDAGPTVARVMEAVAPTWHAQVAPRPPARDPGPAAGPLAANSQPAMLREFGSLLQEAARLGPVVLFLDDVHWADVATVDLLAHLGRQCPWLRVLTILTYRPTELLLGPHPFHRVKLELQGRGVCTELALGFLSRPDFDRYLALAFPGHAFPADFVDLVYARTEGNPLFMVDLLRYLRERGVLAEAGGRWALARQFPDLHRELPQSIRSLIQRKLEQLDEDDRRLLTTASVQGHEFDTAVVASALARDPAEVEERLQALARVHGLVRLAREYEFPDRTLTQRYGFVHGLYQHALYAELSPSRRTALGATLARTLEKHLGEGNPSGAAELACLYEVGRDSGRAARLFHVAAQNAAHLFAHKESIALARRGLRLLKALPEAPEQAALELPLQITLGLQLQVTQGFAAPEAHRAYTRARELCRRVPQAPPQFPVLWGLWLYHKVRSELTTARERAEELAALAGRHQDPDLVLQAHQALAVTTLCLGEPAQARDHMARAMALYDPQRHRTHTIQFGQDPGVACQAFGAVALWLLGYPDRSLATSRAAVALAHQLLQPSSQALALHFAAVLRQCRGEAREALALAELATTIAAEHGFSFWLAGGAVMCGWAQAASGSVGNGVDRLRQGLRDWRATGSVTYQTYFQGLLAEALGQQGQLPEALHVLGEALALAQQTGERLYVAELHRLRGELLLRQGALVLAEAEACFRLALEAARQQQARSLELRAAMSLSRLHRRLGRFEETRPLLAGIYQGFTEGFDTRDLREARALLES